MQPVTDTRLAALSRASQTLSGTLVVDEVLGRVVDGLVQVTGAERGFLVLLDSEDRSVFRVARNRDGSSIDAPETQVSTRTLSRVLNAGEPLLVTDAMGDVELRSFASVAALNLRSILVAPLQTRGRITGALYVDNRLTVGLFEQADLDLLVAFATQAAIVIENARLFEHVDRRVRDLEALREYHDSILASAGSAIVALDPTGHVTSFNRAAEHLFGAAAGDAVGRPYHEVLGPELSARLLRRMLRVMSQGERPDVLDLDGPLAGQRKVLRITMSPLRQVSDGRSLGLVLVADDLTETKLLEEARAREAAEKDRVRAIFGRYVAPAVVEQVLAAGGKLNLSRRQEVSVLFADVRGYTTLSERLSPEEVVELLNRYLKEATHAIFACGGTLDKYMGDAVMAFFNAPLPQADHALAAVRAAQAMQLAVRGIRTEGEAIGYGIGVSTGDAIVGNIGAEELMNFTVIGDTVNVASRIQGIAPAGEVYLSSGTFDQVRAAIEAEELPPVQVRGRQAHVRVYRLIRILSP